MLKGVILVPCIIICIMPQVGMLCAGAATRTGSGLKSHTSLGLSDQAEGSGSTAPLGSRGSNKLGGTSDATVRDKTRDQFAQALAKAVEELGPDGADADAAKVAHDVEVELFKLFGGPRLPLS